MNEAMGIQTAPAPAPEEPPPAGAVVVGVDGSDGAAAALDWAAQEAEAVRRPLVILHAGGVVSGQDRAMLAQAGLSFVELERDLVAAATELLEQARESVVDRHPDLEVSTYLRRTDPRAALLDAAATARVVVVGSRGRGPVASLLLGSVGVAVERYAPCAVVVVRPAPERPRHGVLVGIDGIASEDAALTAAFAAAEARGLPLTVVHCVWATDAEVLRWKRLEPAEPEYDDARLTVSETIAGLAGRFPDVEVSVVLARGGADHCLVDLAPAYDLLVMGRRGTSPLDRIGLGNLATPVVEQAATTVLVVPQ